MEIMVQVAPQPSWETLKDEELLCLRLCDLGVRLEQSELEPRVGQFYAELAAHGDAIKAGSAPVVSTFADGSSVILDPGSSAKITISGQTPTFLLECGTARYTLSALSAVKLNDPVSPPKLTGVYSISCNKPAGWWTTGHMLLLLGGAAAAAGLGFGISTAVSGGAAASPR